MVKDWRVVRVGVGVVVVELSAHVGGLVLCVDELVVQTDDAAVRSPPGKPSGGERGIVGVVELPRSASTLRSDLRDVLW